MTCPHCFSDETTHLQRGIWRCEDCGCGFQEQALNNYHYWTAPWEMHERTSWMGDCKLTNGRGLHIDNEAGSGEAVEAVASNSAAYDRAATE